MNILNHEFPVDIVSSAHEEYPGYFLSVPTENVAWNTRSYLLKDVIVDRLNSNAVVSFGLPHIFNVNELCPGKMITKVNWEDACVYAAQPTIIISRYGGETLVRESGKFPAPGLINLKTYPKLFEHLNKEESLHHSIILQKEHKDWKVLTVIDHFGREMRSPREVKSFCSILRLESCMDTGMRSFDILVKAANIYKTKYYIHFGHEIVKIENNWFADSTCLAGALTIENVINCWIKFPQKDFLTFKTLMMRISPSNQMLNMLEQVKAAYKILLTVFGIFNHFIETKTPSKMPDFLKCFYWDLYRDRKPLESNLKQAYKEIISRITSEKTIDKPLLLEYSGT